MTYKMNVLYAARVCLLGMFLGSLMQLYLQTISPTRAPAYGNGALWRSIIFGLCIKAPNELFNKSTPVGFWITCICLAFYDWTMADAFASGGIFAAAAAGSFLP